MNDPIPDRMKRMADLLVKRGFATGYIINDSQKFLDFDFTELGEIFASSIHQLFRPNGEDPLTIDPNDIKALVALFLFAGPRQAKKPKGRGRK